MITVSFSEIFKWQTCQRQYYYRYGLGLAPLEESDAIRTGVNGHRLLQSFHELLMLGKSKEEALEAVHKQAQKIMSTGRFPDFSLANAWVLVDNYIRDTDFTAEAILVENRYILPASKLTLDPAFEDVQIGFTPDVVFERKGGFLDLEDYKFVQKAWPANKIGRFPQTKLYQIFLETMGYTISRTTIRFFNVKTGKITDTNYIPNDIEKETLLDDFLNGVAEVVAFKRRAPYIQERAARTMNYSACQFCKYAYICGLQAEGKDASETMKTEFKESTYDYTK